MIDEVTLLEKVPEGVLAAVEVAAAGQVVRVLSNPYGIATFFALTPEETKRSSRSPGTDRQPIRCGAENPAGRCAITGDPGGQDLYQW